MLQQISSTWCSCAGLQYGLPGTWNGMRKRGMKPEDLTRLWSTHAAKLAGMQHRKGSLAPGMDADIVVGALPDPFFVWRCVDWMPAAM
jgi:dihydroorotase-like cyclic amidohydrolase